MLMKSRHTCQNFTRRNSAALREEMAKVPLNPNLAAVEELVEGAQLVVHFEGFPRPERGIVKKIAKGPRKDLIVETFFEDGTTVVCTVDGNGTLWETGDEDRNALLECFKYVLVTHVFVRNVTEVVKQYLPCLILGGAPLACVLPDLVFELGPRAFSCCKFTGCPLHLECFNHVLVTHVFVRNVTEVVKQYLPCLIPVSYTHLTLPTKA